MMTQQCQPQGRALRDVLYKLSSAPCFFPVEVIIYWGMGADRRVWAGQMPNVGSAATDLEM